MDEVRAGSESEYLISAETTLDAIIVLDEDSCIFYVNCSAATLFGYAREELVGQPLVRLFPNYRHSTR